MVRWLLLVLLLVAVAAAAILFLRPDAAPSGIPGPADEALGRSGIEETDNSPYVVTDDAGAGTVTRDPSE
ncbi:hypothetical protein [Thermaurantiacus sp.]